MSINRRLSRRHPTRISNRAQRASARGCANATPHVPPEPITDSQQVMDIDTSPVVPDDDITVVAPSSSVENNGEGPSKPISGRGRRRADKRIVLEQADVPVIVKEEPIAPQIPDIAPPPTAAVRFPCFPALLAAMTDGCDPTAIDESAEQRGPLLCLQLPWMSNLLRWMPQSFPFMVSRPPGGILRRER